jgi:hypothetical protein
MKISKRVWAVVAIMAVPIGIIIGKYGLLRPTPGAFAFLGIVAGLCIAGIVYGVREGRRAAQHNRGLSN